MISQSLLDNQPQANQSLEAGTGGAREPAAQTPKNGFGLDSRIV
jgi:hypothetical protein